MEWDKMSRGSVNRVIGCVGSWCEYEVWFVKASRRLCVEAVCGCGCEFGVWFVKAFKRVSVEAR